MQVKSSQQHGYTEDHRLKLVLEILYDRFLVGNPAHHDQFLVFISYAWLTDEDQFSESVRLSCDISKDIIKLRELLMAAWHGRSRGFKVLVDVKSNRPDGSLNEYIGQIKGADAVLCLLTPVYKSKIGRQDKALYKEGELLDIRRREKKGMNTGIYPFIWASNGNNVSEHIANSCPSSWKEENWTARSLVDMDFSDKLKCIVKELLIPRTSDGFHSLKEREFDEIWAMSYEELLELPQLKDIKTSGLTRKNSMTCINAALMSAPKVIEPKVSNIPVRNRRFVGRVDFLSEKEGGVLNSLTDRSGRYSGVVLTGLGGVGKDEIACEYAHQYGSRYDIIWCINFDDLVKDCRDLADQLNTRFNEILQGKNININKMKPIEIFNYLRNSLRMLPNWFIIMKNVKDEKSLSFLPEHNPSQNRHLLMTSRFRGFTQFRMLKVLQFSRLESLALFQGLLSINNEDKTALVSCDKISEILHDFPSSIYHSAYFLFQSPTYTLQNFLELYSGRRELFYKYVGMYPGGEDGRTIFDYNSSLRTCWSLNCDIAEAKKELVDEIFMFLALLSQVHVSLDMLIDLIDPLKREVVHELINLLNQNNCLTATPYSVILHPLLHQILREVYWRNALFKSKLVRVIDYLHERFVFDEPITPEHRIVLEVYAPHVESVLELSNNWNSPQLGSVMKNVPLSEAILLAHYAHYCQQELGMSDKSRQLLQTATTQLSNVHNIFISLSNRNLLTDNAAMAILIKKKIQESKTWVAQKDEDKNKPAVKQTAPPLKAAAKKFAALGPAKSQFQRK